MTEQQRKDIVTAIGREITAVFMGLESGEQPATYMAFVRLQAAVGLIAIEIEEQWPTMQ